MTRRLASLFGSLKLRLAAVGVAALALGIGITTAVLVNRAETGTINERQRLELGEAVRTGRLLGARVVRAQQTLATIAGRIDAHRLDAASVRTEFEQHVALPVEFSAIFVAGIDGRVRLMHDAQGYSVPDLQLADRAYFRRTLMEGRAIVSDPLVGRLVGEPVIVLTQPIFDGATLVAVLATSLRLRSQDLLADVADPVEGDEGVLVVVTDVNGTILAHPDNSLVGASLAAEPRLAESMATWRDAGKPVEPQGLLVSDARRLVAVAGVGNAEWIVWRSRLRADVLAPLLSGRVAALRWAAALVGAFALVLSGLLWWLLRPLTRLQARARHLFEGPAAADLDDWPQAGGEIGQLETVLRQVVRERAQLEGANRAAIRRLESVMDSAPVGIAFERNGHLELVSTQFRQLLARDEAMLLGQTLQPLFASDEDHRAFAVASQLDFELGRPYQGEWPLLRRDGHPFWARLRGQPVDWQDPGAGTIWTLNDITDEVTARQALEWAALHDSLTGLPNRPAFEKRLAQVFQALPRSKPAALLMFDLDRFKVINDRHGHSAGDAMLRAIATAASGRVRSGDLLVRLGGDEFAVILERCTLAAALRVAEQLRDAVAAIRLPWDGTLLDVDASVGVAPLADAITSAPAWVEAADRACYDAKSAGRGTVRVWSEASAATPRGALRLVAGGDPAGSSS